MHVLWAGPGHRPYTAIFDTPVSPGGSVGQPRAVVSGWDGVQPPAAVAAADGSIHAVISGQQTPSNSDPYAGLNDVVGPGSWKLGAHAYGSYSISVASSADVDAAFLKSSQLLTVWESAAKLLFQVGVDPATQPQDITPPGLAINAAVGVDQGSGDAVIAYQRVSDGLDFFRRILPSLGAPVAMPQAKSPVATIAARSGGGLYSAYTPDGGKVVLLPFGGGSKAVPVPKGTRVLVAGVAAGPEGRLWVFYGNEQQTYVTRTSKAVGGYEPVQTLASPPKAVQYFRLEGEGSAGPLDLFADVTVDGQTKDGSYHQQVHPMLSLSSAKKTLKGGAAQVTFHVTDAGDGVQGAKVTGLPGGAKTSAANGSVVVKVPAGKKGMFSLTATKAGYVAAQEKLLL